MLYKNPEQGKAYEKISYEIPPILRTVHPGVTPEIYKAVCKDPNFLKKTIRVCEMCLMDFYDSFEGYVSGSKSFKEDFIGTGSLRPEILKQRTEVRER